MSRRMKRKGKHQKRTCKHCGERFTTDNPRASKFYCSRCSRRSAVRRSRARADFGAVLQAATERGIAVRALDPHFVGVRFEGEGYTVDAYPGACTHRLVNGAVPAGLAWLPRRWELADVLQALTDAAYMEKRQEERAGRVLGPAL